MNCDLTKLETERRNPETMDLDVMSALEIATVMNKEDAQVLSAIQNQLPQIAAAIDLCSVVYQKGGRLVYLGAGSSGRYAVADAVECHPTFGVGKKTFTALLAGGHRAIWNSVEGAEDSAAFAEKDLKKAKLNNRDVLIGLTASGRTPYVLAGMRLAKTLGVKTIGISCTKADLISEFSDIVINLSCGPEILTGSTRLKCGTAEKLVLNMISTGAMVRSGKVYQNLMVDVIQSNEKLHARAENIVMEATGCSSALANRKLAEADGYCKVAIVSILLKCDVKEARRALKQNGGFVRKAVLNEKTK